MYLNLAILFRAARTVRFLLGTCGPQNSACKLHFELDDVHPPTTHFLSRWPDTEFWIDLCDIFSNSIKRSHSSQLRRCQVVEEQSDHGPVMF